MKKIVISQDPVTSTPSFHRVDSVQARNESASTRVKKWFLDPLRLLDGDEGFLVLLILFPLYEKHLRASCGFTGSFSEGNPIFRIMGRQLKLSEGDACAFWTHMRNGILHQAQPKASDRFDYGIRSNGIPIERIDERFWINPFALRDALLPIIEEDVRNWKQDDVPLAITFDQIEH